MAPTNPTDHDLNALLARVVGVEIAEFRPEEWYCVANPADIASGSMRWNPLHDANQMLLVRKNLGLCSWEMSRIRGRVFVKISNDHPQMGSPNVWEANNHDELRAFALAVVAWWKEMKKSNE